MRLINDVSKFSCDILLLNITYKYIFAAVLYGLETCSVTLEEEHTMSVQNKTKQNKKKDKWRKLHKEELHKLYSSINIIQDVAHLVWMIKA
jgi:hypothetical protein